MSARNSGKRAVIVAVSATVTAVGIGTIWAPFYADRDKLRGLHEEADGMSERERAQYQAYLQQIQQQQSNPANQTPVKNSMWSRMDQQGSGK